MYLLDSDVIVGFLRGNTGAVEKIKNLEEKNASLCISSISIHELLEGAYLSLKPKENLEAIRDFVNRVVVLDFTFDCAKISGKISADLTRKGEKIGDIDVLLSSIAICNGLILVTRNTRHFSKINILKLLAW
ncbi:MAG: type II toxin-antitoxin system VapC family toxin [Candidatus Woesearchaeota archaeon]